MYQYHKSYNMTFEACAVIGIRKDIKEVLELILDRNLSNELEKINKNCKDALRNEWNEHKKEWDDYDEKLERYRKRYAKNVKNNPDPKIYKVKYDPPMRLWKKRYNTYDEYVVGNHKSELDALVKCTFYDSDNYRLDESPLHDIDGFDIISTNDNNKPVYFVVPSGLSEGSDIDLDTLKDVLPVFEEIFGEKATLESVNSRW